MSDTLETLRSHLDEGEKERERRRERAGRRKKKRPQRRRGAVQHRGGSTAVPLTPEAREWNEARARSRLSGIEGEVKGAGKRVSGSAQLGTKREKAQAELREQIERQGAFQDNVVTRNVERGIGAVPGLIARTIPDEVATGGHIGGREIGMNIPEVRRSPTAQGALGQASARGAAAAVEEAGLSLLGSAARTPGQISEAMAYIPAGLYYGAKDPVGTAQAMAEGIKQDFTNPLERSGYLLADIWGLGAAARGAGGRGYRAAKHGPRELFRPSVPQIREAAPGAFYLEAGSEIARDIGALARRLGIHRTPRQTGALSQQYRNLVTAIHNAAPETLAKASKKITLAESEAIFAVARQTPLQTIRSTLGRNLQDATGTAARNLDRRIAAVNEAITKGYVVSDGGQVAISPKYPKLQEIADLTRKASERTSETRVRYGLDTPEGQQAALARKVEESQGTHQIRLDLEEWERALNEKARGVGRQNLNRAGGAYGRQHKKTMAASREIRRTRQALEEARQLQDDLVRLQEEMEGMVGRPLTDPLELKHLQNVRRQIQSTSRRLGDRLRIVERHANAVVRERTSSALEAEAAKGLADARAALAAEIQRLRTAAQEASARAREVAPQTEGAFFTTERIDPSLQSGSHALRKGSTTIGIPKWERGARARYGGANLRAGRTPENIPRTTALREQLYNRGRMKHATWQHAVEAGVPARRVLDMIESGELNPRTFERHWAAVRVKPGANRAETRTIIDKWLSGNPDEAGYLVRAVKEGNNAADDLAALADDVDNAGQVVFADSRMFGMRPFRGTDKHPVVAIIDSVTQLAQMSTLFTKGTGFLTPNLMGQGFMTAVHGLRASLDMMTGSPLRTLVKLNPTERRVLIEIGGAGYVRSVTSGRKGVFQTLDTVHGKVATVYGWVLDDLWRANGVVVEARKRGYRGIDGIRRLVRDAQSLPEGAPKLADLTEGQKNVLAIRESVRRTYGAFDRMTDVERDVVRRVVWFYPVIKGLADYTARLPAEHPMKFAVGVQLGAYARDEVEARFGELVMRLLPGVFPTDTEALGMPVIIDPRSASVTGTILEFLEFQQNPGKFLRDQLTPGLALPLLVLGFNPRGGHEDDRPFIERLAEWGKGFVPGAVLSNRLKDGQGDNRLFWYTPRQAVMQFVKGSVGERTLNMPRAEEIAQDEYVPRAEQARAAVDAEIEDATRLLPAADAKRVKAALLRQYAIKEAIRGVEAEGKEGDRERAEITARVLSEWHPRMSDQFRDLLDEAGREDTYKKAYELMYRWAYSNTVTKWHEIYDPETRKVKPR